MRADKSVRVLNDNQLEELVHQLTKRVEESLAAKHRVKNEDINDLLVLTKTIPVERMYWRALLRKREQEVDRWRKSFYDREEHVVQLKYDLYAQPRILEKRNKEMKEEMANLEQECANEVAAAREKTQALLTALGQWAYEQGLAPEEETAET